MKLLLAAALALLMTMGVAACGGDDSDDPTASTATTTQETAPDQSGSGEQEKEPAGDRDGSDGGSSDDSSAGDDSSQEKGSAAFRTQGGDNSIQNYGEEADAEEREAASTTVIGFMEARAEDDWKAVCGYMAEATLKPLEQLATRAPQFKGKDCPELLEGLTGSTPASSRTNTAADGIASLRFEGERAFALYHGTDGSDYFLPLVNEDGEWKVGALAPSEFPG